MLQSGAPTDEEEDGHAWEAIAQAEQNGQDSIELTLDAPQGTSLHIPCHIPCRCN